MSRTWHSREGRVRSRRIVKSNNRLGRAMFAPRYTCPSGKRCYDSKSDADAMLRLVQAKRASHLGGYSERSVYRCGKCGSWHLTSWKGGRPV